MNKKGFTLIELLATIILMSVIATIIISVTVKKLNEMKQVALETLISSIEMSAKDYVMENENTLPQFINNDWINVTLQTLLENNYFDKELKNPVTKQGLPISDTVYVTRSNSGKIITTYNINQNTLPRITLNGAYNMYIKQNSTFTDPGVSAVNESGTDVTSSVVITGSVVTTTPGIYTLTYTYQTTSIQRIVIVS